jgi:hypothetical protein
MVLAVLPHWTPSAVVCVVLLTIGGLLIRSHLRTWSQRQSEEWADQSDRLHYEGQLRRRIQTSALMALIGVLIFVGDVIGKQLGPKFIGYYWIVVLGLVCYLVVLAVLDGLATATHTRAAIARLRAQRRQLEREAAELKERRMT